jgi:transcriptional regulator with XRE-family HTH domain
MSKKYKIIPISESLKKIRKSKKIKQLELCYRCGVDYNTLKKVESGATTNPTVDTITRIAWGLGVGIEELVVIVKSN